MTAEKPLLFIGSSSEGLRIAELLQAGLDHDVDASLWSQGLFKPSEGRLKNLVEMAQEFHAAVLVLTADDMLSKRGRRHAAPRDNVIFELGLFMGALGPEKTFMVHAQGEGLALPSDLAGVTSISYRSRADNNMQAALGPVCTKIKEHLRRFMMLAPARTQTLREVPRRRRRRSLGTAHIRGERAGCGIVNISTTGAFLETHGAIPVGRVLHLALDLEDGKSIQAMAEVVRIQDPDWGRVGGVGITFTASDDCSQELLRDYVESDYLQEGASPGGPGSSALDH